jgi:hypothetical protein
MADESSIVANESGSTSAPAGGDAPGGAASTPASSDVSRESSTPHSGEGAESRESLLDVVRKAAPRNREAQPGPGDERGVSRSGESAAPGSAQSKEDLGPLTQAEVDAYSPRTRKRIDEFRAQINGLKSQIGPLEAQAQTTQALQTFLKQADIAKEDFGLVLDLAAAMRRGDFRTFLEGVAPYVKLAQESLGIQLPPDLAQAVRGGHMTADAARYTAQVRAQQQLAQGQLTRVTQEQTQRSHTEAVREFQASVAGAVTEWEKGVRRSDPDYARKEPVVQKLLHAVVHERGPPRSPAEAVEIAKLAYEQATAMASRFVPNPRATHQVPSSINRVNGARTEPKSLKEAIHFAIERSR